MEAVGQLTGGIAHDFNNLLTGIIGSLDLMQKRIAQGRFGEIERYATLAKTLGQPRRGADPPPARLRAAPAARSASRSTSTQLVALDGGTAAAHARRADRARDRRGRRACGVRFCDPHQLESALLNLAINARDAMPDGGRLTIETANAHLDSVYAARAARRRAGEYVLHLRSPTPAPACRPTVRARAFDPFFTTKPIGQGTGLGLSMIYGFARQSDGHVAHLLGGRASGTTVQLYLPRYRGAVADAPGAARQPAIAQRARARRDRAGDRGRGTRCASW